MRRRANALSFILMVALLVAAGGLGAGARGVHPNQAYMPNQYIVRAAAGASQAVVEQAVARMGATLLKSLPLSDTYLIGMGQSGSRRTVYQGHGAYAQLARWVIESVQPNYLHQLHAVPNDEYWNKLWDMRLINMPGAWEITKGSPNVVVAVIDSGVADHPELVNRKVAGYDFNEGDNDPSNDTDGHGTHVSGTIAAQGNNAIGISGVCWNSVKIMPIRFFGPNPPTTDILLQCYDYALKNGAHIINMSYGGPFDDTVEHAKIQELAAAGLVLVASAGNGGDDSPNYPAFWSECISVSAIGPYDAIAPYSTYGKVEIAAPGGDGTLGVDAFVYSTTVTWNGTTPVYDYAGDGWQGTSMAAPHVTGAAALLLSYGVPAADVRNRLIASARPPKSGGMDPTKYGAGILDVQAALANAVVRIGGQLKGATVGTSPSLRINIQGINLATIKVYLDYADLNGDGTPDDPNEGIIIDGTSVYFYLNTTRTAVEFNPADILGSPLAAGQHNLYVTADAMAGGGTVSDWAVFTVARRMISKGVHLVAFPYELTARTTDTPAKVLPGARFGLVYNPRSTLTRWIASPRSLIDLTPSGYDTYNPLNVNERVWNNPLTTIGGTTVTTGGGYYYDNVTRERKFAFPAGSGFWLVLPTDVYVDETYSTLESLPNFDGSKGFEIPLYKGWNMIGNPYAHEVPWRAALFTYQGQTKTLLDAESAGWVRSTMFGYGGSTVGYQRVTDRDLLEPYSGYWLLALVGGVGQSDGLTLSILP